MDAPDAADLLACLKRVKERWIADEVFRDKAARDWTAALREYHLAAPETGLHAAVADALSIAGNPEAVAPVAEIRRRLSAEGGVAPAPVADALRELWQAGVLVEAGWARLESAR